MKEGLSSLNSLLFEELERLGNSDLTGEKLEEELRRAAGVAKISTNIINNANLALQAVKMQQEYPDKVKMPAMLLGDGNGDA